MRHFGAILFGGLTVISALAVLWLSHGAGTADGHAAAFGQALSPLLYLIFVGPLALLFVLSIIRGMK